MQNYIAQWINLGISSEVSRFDKTVLKAMNITSLGVIFVDIVFVVYFLFFREYFSQILFPSISGLFFILVLVANAKTKFLVGKLLFIVSPVLIHYLILLVLGKVYPFEYTLIVLLLLWATMIYNKKIQWQIGSWLITLVIYLIFKFTDYYFPVNIDIANALLVEIIVFSVILFMLFVVFNLMKTTIADAENDREKFINKLKEKNEDLNAFASIASHDMKAPLRTIKSFSQLLRLKIGNEEEETEYINFIENSSDQMLSLLDDLLAFAKSDMEEIQLEKIDLNTLLSQVKNNLWSSIQEKNAIVEWLEMPTIEIHKNSIFQVFQNLISNGVKYQHQDKPEHQPQIQIKSKIETDFLIFSVKDNGIGIDPKSIDKVFEVFSRVHNKEKYEGSGIGLATCKKIVNRFGGKIWVESKEGQGSTFFFSLPVNLLVVNTNKYQKKCEDRGDKKSNNDIKETILQKQTL